MATENTRSAKGKAAAIISKPSKSELAGIVPELIHWFRQHQYQVVVDRETAPHAAGVEVLTRDEMSSRPLSLAVVLGGDGTLLSAARAVAKAGDTASNRKTVAVSLTATARSKSISA